MNRLNMQSKNILGENMDFIASKFPNVITETKDDKGNLTRKIDFELLMQELSGEIVESNKERYQLTWPGKKEAILMANTPIKKTLRPDIEGSVDFENTENLYIEGDNLEVLKLLQESYLGKVKCIYIDPPYNTSQDFIYKDNYTVDKEEYEANSSDFDELGNRLFKNTDSNGRFHSDYLSMMYSRLKCARNLLREDGVILISIDDSESHNLRKVCDEVFGAHNFITLFIWQNKKGGGNDSKYVAIEHEYVMMYSKNKEFLEELFESYDPKYLKRYKEEDKIGKFYWDTFKRKSGKQYYAIKCPDGTILEKDEMGNPISWLRSEARFRDDIKKGEIRIIKVNNNWTVHFKQRLPKGKKPRSIYYKETLINSEGTTSDGSKEILNLFNKDIFPNPKPVSLIKYLVSVVTQEEDIVLDFFSGSATTAHAILELNSETKEIRPFIMVQDPENLEWLYENTSSDSRQYIVRAMDVLKSINKPNILSEIGKERIRRAAKKIKEETNADIDYGFRVYKVDSTNMKDTYYSIKEITQGNLLETESNIKEDRTPEDLLTQVILDLGLELSLKIEEKNINGKKVFYVDEDSLVACFDEGVDKEIAMEIAKDMPMKVVFRDSCFSNDSIKENIKEIFKKYSNDTDIKVL